MYVVKEPLGLGHPLKPHPLGFYSGKEEEGGAVPSLCSCDVFYIKK